MNKYLGTILNATRLTTNIFKLVVSVPELTEIVSPGQFCQIRIANDLSHDPLLRRPISIADYDPSRQKLSFIIRESGRGTKFLARLFPGQKIDLFGPLGTGFPVHHLAKGDHALLIAGGVGAPPLYFLARQLHAKGVECTTILGFRSQSESFLLDEFSEFGQVRVVTDDGTLGKCGNACTELTACATEGLRWTHGFACGPLPMLKALQQQLSADHRPVWISLEKRMACGLGACAACTCQPTNLKDTQGWPRLVCTDGPVFRLGEVELSE